MEAISMTPPQLQSNSRDRDEGDADYQYLVSRATEDHVALAGRYTLHSPSPDSPSQLLGITKIALGVDSLGANREPDQAARTGDASQTPRSWEFAISLFIE
jgi:hypothetical protein